MVKHDPNINSSLEAQSVSIVSNTPANELTNEWTTTTTTTTTTFLQQSAVAKKLAENALTRSEREGKSSLTSSGRGLGKFSRNKLLPRSHRFVSDARNVPGDCTLTGGRGNCQKFLTASKLVGNEPRKNSSVPLFSLSLSLSLAVDVASNRRWNNKFPPSREDGCKRRGRAISFERERF